MNLNIDCCRDILLAIETRPLGKYFTVNQLYEKLPSHDPDELYYACLKLKEADFLNVVTIGEIPKTHTLRINTIDDITFSGHEFLENIRVPSTWEKAKSIAANGGSFSLEILATIAKEIVLGLLHKHL